MTSKSPFEIKWPLNQTEIHEKHNLFFNFISYQKTNQRKNTLRPCIRNFNNVEGLKRLKCKEIFLEFKVSQTRRLCTILRSKAC